MLSGRAALAWLNAATRRFASARGGNIALVAAFGLMTLAVAVGAGIDLSRAYLSRQKLSQVATLACQYASRPSVVQNVYTGTAGQGTYRTNVSAFITRSLQTQSFVWTQTNATPFTYVAGGAADVNLTANVPTTIMKIVNVNQMPIQATTRCFATPAELPQRVPDGSEPFLVKEGFETLTCSNCYQYTRPDGTTGTRSSPLATRTDTPGYNGSDGTRWYVMGYCIEIDSVGVIKTSVPAGRFSAELDCDNGAGQSGNSSISTRTYLPAGSYELRYNYTSRIYYPDYAPIHICGSTAAETAWATSTRSSGGPRGNVARSNQINVYLDLDAGALPTHTAIEGAQVLGGSNLIDMCVEATDWIERSVRINVTTPGFYWLSFAADGANDSYGGQIDDVRLCQKTCTDTMDDAFPKAWLAANNGGVVKQLFRDGFELPLVLPNVGDQYSTAGNLNQFLGTSLTPLLGYGWPGQASSGWATAPFNQADILAKGSAEGKQSLELDASSPAPYNRLTGRPFLLVPGYYQLDYKYIAGGIFPSLSGVYCGATPATSGVNGLTGTAAGSGRVVVVSGTSGRDTNLIAVFMSNALLVSYPVGGGALNSATNFHNPNGTVTATATVAPNAISLTAYNAAQPNPLLDICGYATTWQSRTATIKITKTGTYWLTFAALGTAEQIGGNIDDVKLTALGSPYIAAPANAVTIPAPAAVAGSVLSFTGFSIVANPFTSPAP